MKTGKTFGRCRRCGAWVEDCKCQNCVPVWGPPWGSWDGDYANPAQENAIRHLEDALSQIDDHLFGQAA